MKKGLKYLLIAFVVIILATYIYGFSQETIKIGNTKYILNIEKTKDLPLDEFLGKYKSGDFAELNISDEQKLVGYILSTGNFDKSNTGAISDKLKSADSFYNLYLNIVYTWELIMGRSVHLSTDSSIYSLRMSDDSILTTIYAQKYTSTKPIISNINELGIYPVNENTQLVVNDNSSSGFLSFILDNVLPLLMMAGVAILLLRFISPKGGMGGLPFNFKIGKSNAEGLTNTTFADVAGMEEVKGELEEIVDFLKNPAKYNAVGAKIPKGVLMYGSPGSGKTLLARAIAGEAGVPFYAASGSEFMEMLVGMGAAKVRELFGKAKLTSPSIIFIDEIDAIGRKRGSGSSGGHQEQEQTLNQILTEMDGFEQGQTVIVIAATNRPDTLDPALLRSGRFDRKIYVSNPQLEERIEILKYHLKNKKIADDVMLDAIARKTSGFVGADIANMVNEAALKVAKDNRDILTNDDLDYGLEKMLMGPEKRIKTLQESERKTVIYHELGHAIIGYILPNCDPVEKISIVSRGKALGVTWMMPTEDKYLRSKAKYIDDITSLLGGRAAEEIFFGEDNITTGASNDFEKVTAYIYDMLTKYGMDSELGTIQYTSNEYTDYKLYSEKTAEKIDDKVRFYIGSIYENAKKIVIENAELMKLLAELLDKREYIYRDEFEKIMQNRTNLEEVKNIVNEIIAK